jgi:hypothetical protein
LQRQRAAELQALRCDDSDGTHVVDSRKTKPGVAGASEAG